MAQPPQGGVPMQATSSQQLQPAPTPSMNGVPHAVQTMAQAQAQAQAQQAHIQAQHAQAAQAHEAYMMQRDGSEGARLSELDNL